MTRLNRIAVLAISGIVVGASLVGCSSADGKGDKGGKKIAVVASDKECKVDTVDLPAGVHTFVVRNNGSKVTEFYVYSAGDRIVGEVENIAPGLSRELHVELAAGSYQAACKPGMIGDGIRATLTVTGEAVALTEDTKLADAVQGYTRYVRSQVEALVTKTEEFTAAVKAGDKDKAKALFPIARTYWERIEPVAEALGEFDPLIDAREDGVEPGQEWTGFHKIEKDLWETGDISGSGPMADRLLADIKRLAEEIAKLEIKPLDLANGAKELLDEVATFKVTGEEDRYSHTDLWDFSANVEGSQAAVAALRLVIDDKEPTLGKVLDEKFAAIEAELAKHRLGDGFKSYTDLTKDQIKTLADAVNALGEPVSKVAAVIAKK